MKSNKTIDAPKLTHSILVPQVDRLEEDPLEVLRLVRSARNTLAPINRVPPELFESLIPQHWSKNDTDRAVITMTHVCQRWRAILTTRSSLWTRLVCTDAEKTRTYIERSKSTPLEINVHRSEHLFTLKNVLPLVIPHNGRVASIHITGDEYIFGCFAGLLSGSIPLLRDLQINLTDESLPILDDTLFNGDLSSLSRLFLRGVISNLPWTNLSKLTTFSFFLAPKETVSITGLLDLFENAPLLSKVELGSIPDFSDAPPGRVVSLPYLEELAILTGQVQSSSSPLLNHILIPTGARLLQQFTYSGDEFPIFNYYLPKSPKNLHNILNVTSVHLQFDREPLQFGGKGTFIIRLTGPNGEFDATAIQKDSIGATPMASDRGILQSLDYFALSGSQRLLVYIFERPTYGETYESLTRCTLNVMQDLRTLILLHYSNLPFTIALNPDKNSQKLTLCPKLEKLVLGLKPGFDFKELIGMAKERALRDVRLQLVTLISDPFHSGMASEEELSELGKYVTHVECETWETVSFFSLSR